MVLSNGATPTRFHTKSPTTVGVYHVREDCPHAVRVRTWNRCYADAYGQHVKGCAWKGLTLDPCSACARGVRTAD